MSDFIPYNPNQAAVEVNADIRARYTEAYRIADRDQNLYEATRDTHTIVMSDVHPDSLSDELGKLDREAKNKSYDSRAGLRALTLVAINHYDQNADAILDDAVKTYNEDPSRRANPLKLKEDLDVPARQQKHVL